MATREDWIRYEEEKRRAWEESTTMSEYEERMRKIREELKL